jgi:hypothetical protein
MWWILNLIQINALWFLNKGKTILAYKISGGLGQIHILKNVGLTYRYELLASRATPIEKGQE